MSDNESHKRLAAQEWLASLKVVNHFAQLGDDFSTKVLPLSLDNPRMVDVSPEAATELGIDETLYTRALVGLLNGQGLPESFEPIAMLYAGHQFGSWVPQLGDGRAMILAQIETPNNQLWELQLKGAGPTPYSRQSDGRAALRSTIREYLCSEAMQALGIPTTRALALIDSDTPVYREEVETGATLLRMAASHVRFGSFELFASRSQPDQVRILADHLIEQYRPELKDNPLPYLALYRDVIKRTAELIADWQAVGFSHGVMNTDNMSILGLTIDYGPFGFMEAYNPGFICNHSDHSGRYAFNRQPDIAWWNLAALGNGLLPLLELDQAKEAIEEYKDLYQQAFQNRYLQKFGLVENLPEDDALIEDWLNILAQQSIDFTNAFRALCYFSTDAETPAALAELFTNSGDFRRWLERYSSRLTQQEVSNVDRQRQMLAANPKYILRNYLAENAIAKAKQGDYSEVVKLRQILSRPFDEQRDHTSYAKTTPAWAANLSVSCSS
jgi:uncharacterized protein YdiU (UPF0061 family)|tara:strand:- start:113249 stop:114745 length:1497 start_codon:yes stop_codon:yes gene_type:complete